jgi:hypothetical protein
LLLSFRVTGARLHDRAPASSKGENMRRLRFALPAIVCCLFVAAVAAPAFAQEDCFAVCGGNTPCGRDCSYCDITPDIGLLCPGWAFHSVTCGDFTNWCIEDGCNSDWVEVSRELQGSYGEFFGYFCHHHSVYWVTEYDNNQCVRNPDGWYHNYCHDEEDGTKTIFDVNNDTDCCDGLGPDGLPDSTFNCNHYHHCTG